MCNTFINEGNNFARIKWNSREQISGNHSTLRPGIVFTRIEIEYDPIIKIVIFIR